MMMNAMATAMVSLPSIDVALNLLAEAQSRAGSTLTAFEFIPRLMVEAALAEHGETSTDRRRLTAEFFHSRRLLASLANNVNQIARATNAGERPGDELQHALRAVREVSAKIDALLPELVSSR